MATGGGDGDLRRVVARELLRATLLDILNEVPHLRRPNSRHRPPRKSRESKKKGGGGGTNKDPTRAGKGMHAATN